MFMSLPHADAIYVDEKAGSDATGSGSITSPFATPLAALISATTLSSPEFPATRTVLVRKPDSVEIAEWVPISGAGLKKAKKNLEGHWKKVKKAEEGKEAKAKEEREKAEREAKRREEASKIVLTEDVSQGKAPKVRLGGSPGTLIHRQADTLWHLVSPRSTASLLSETAGSESLAGSTVSARKRT
jgi:asparaginyl-tRNA synthetase